MGVHFLKVLNYTMEVVRIRRDWEIPLGDSEQIICCLQVVEDIFSDVFWVSPSSGVIGIKIKVHALGGPNKPG